VSDIITSADLLDYGLSARDMRSWPVPEYTDAQGDPYWLLSDLEDYGLLDREQGGAD
jgi:hypothetical protein